MRVKIQVCLLAAMPVGVSRLKTCLSAKKFIIICDHSKDFDSVLQHLTLNHFSILLIDDAFFTEAEIKKFISQLTVLQRRKTIIYTGTKDAVYLKWLTDCDIGGIVLNRSPKKKLIDAIEQVSAGSTYIDRRVNVIIFKNKIAKEIQTNNFYEFLTKREKEVMQLINEGFENKAIAYKLNISVSTVGFHKENIKIKLGTNSVKDLYNMKLYQFNL